MVEMLGVAEAKRRFSELIERVRAGERFVVARRGRPVMALVPPETEVARSRPTPLGLAAFAGALAEWDDMDQFVKDVYAARRRARDRPAPEIELE